jgi:predicted nucleic acid-binding protein
VEGSVPREASAEEQEGRVKNGITFDTGALIALERRGQRVRKVLERAVEQKVRITVPVAVITEWWRGRSDVGERILAAVRVEPLSDGLAKVAGEAIAAVKGATPIDAIVMASAAQRGDVVYTADVSDLQKLAAYFPAVRVLGIG